MDTALDEATKEALLRDIIAEGSDAISLFLNETDGLEGEGEQAGYGDLMPVQEEEHEDGSGDPICRCKKETVMTALVTEPSPARYIY